MPVNGFEFEICANSVESCLVAQESGADRVELCAALSEGGLTPSFGEIAQARRVLHTTRLHVIIRPRGGDFIYSPLELERMKTDITICRQLGVDGIVFGCLDSNGAVDIDACKTLLAAAEGMSVTFHRAFDRCKHPEQALETIISLGFDRLLTSGQQKRAEEGITLLHELNQQADGRIQLMAGSGINEHNIRHIMMQTGIRQFHFSATQQLDSNDDLGFGARQISDKQKILNTISAITNR